MNGCCVIRESLTHHTQRDQRVAVTGRQAPYSAFPPQAAAQTAQRSRVGESGAMAADDEYDDDFEEIIADEDEDDFAPPSAAKAAAAAPVDDMLSDFDAVRAAGFLLRR